MIEQKPIVLLYAAAFAKGHDQGFIDYTRQQFPKDFSGRIPYLAPQDSWQVKGDNVCHWGGALGLRRQGIAELGPGYDHSAVPGRTPLVKNRESGKFYEESWTKFLRNPESFVMIETWNEFHEGTDICESKEYGRQYIDLTRHYADLFKSGWKPPQATGKYSGAKAVSVRLGQKDFQSGIQRVESEDGQTQAVLEAGQEARKVTPNGGNSRYIYFRLDDSFKRGQAMNAILEVEYLDRGTGGWLVEYDGSDESAPFHGAYTHAVKAVSLEGTGKWKTAHIQLPAARFLNSQNQDADFRLAALAPELVVRRVVIQR